MPHDFLRRTIIPRLAKRVQVEGIENVPERGPYLLVANHQSYVDAVQTTFVLLLHRNHKPWFLTTEHVWKRFRAIGGSRVLRWLGMIPIFEAKRAESLQPAIEILRSGGVVAVFPEGMRNKPKVNPQWGSVMLKGKTGTARLALATGVPVIPTGLVAPKGFTAFEAIRNYFNPKSKAIVRFGSPIRFPVSDLSQVTKVQLEDVTRQIVQKVADLCGKEYPY